MAVQNLAVSKKIQLGSWQIELLPSSPYEVKYTPSRTIIGFSFDSQCGTHSFASDKRCDFHAKPNGLAVVPAGCDVYSSSSGGEYLKVECMAASERVVQHSRQFSDEINPHAIAAAFALRRAILSDDAIDHLAFEHGLMTMEACVQYTLRKPSKVSCNGDWLSVKRIKLIDDIVEARLDENITVSQLASELGVSCGFFSREFKKGVGRSPYQYIVDRRLARARQILFSSREGLSSIAYTCGFSSHSHMSALFRERLGITPMQLRLSAGVPDSAASAT